MINATEKVVTNYINEKKNKDADNKDKKSEDFPSDTISMAKMVDKALSELSDAYERLRDRTKKDSNLSAKIKDSTNNEAGHIIR